MTDKEKTCEDMLANCRAAAENAKAPVAGFVLFDPRPGEYLRLDRRKGWTWGESAERAFVFASREEADTAKVIYGTERPEAFVHRVTSTGPSPNAPGAS